MLRTNHHVCSHHHPRTTPALRIAIFFALGVLQTLLALVLFERADDHAYFLEVANDGIGAVVESGVEQSDLKAQAAAIVFHALASPSRWIGAGEIGHLVWLRLLTLAGFLFAFEWVRRTLRPGSNTAQTAAARKRFMVLCLLYPGQLAWTASLLRDGPACTFLFAAMLAWSLRRHVIAIACMTVSLALRPEFVLVVAVLALAVHLATRLHVRKHRVLLLTALCGLISVTLFEPRLAASEFAQLAFTEGGFAYPAIAHPLDFVGYALVLMQALMDPISITALATPSPFSLAEAAFFAWLLLSGLRRMPSVSTRAAGLLAGLFASMWLFAYFEIFVSGYSRHRLALVILLIAVNVLTEPHRQRRRLSRKSSSMGMDRPPGPSHALGPAA